MGQMVALAPNRLQKAAAGDYEIRHLMPESDVKTDSPRYRVKSTEEKHERVVRESDLLLPMDAAQVGRQSADCITLPVIEP
ncbi:MAG: hypothetical protein ACLP1D_22285 [Xanthobacteraceae bacterium]